MWEGGAGALAARAATPSEGHSGKVVEVVSGDTIIVRLDDGREVRLSLARCGCTCMRTMYGPRIPPNTRAQPVRMHAACARRACGHRGRPSRSHVHAKPRSLCEPHALARTCRCACHMSVRGMFGRLGAPVHALHASRTRAPSRGYQCTWGPHPDSQVPAHSQPCFLPAAQQLRVAKLCSAEALWHCSAVWHCAALRHCSSVWHLLSARAAVCGRKANQDGAARRPAQLHAAHA
jgi:hypothetical protein